MAGVRCSIRRVLRLAAFIMRRLIATRAIELADGMDPIPAATPAAVLRNAPPGKPSPVRSSLLPTYRFKLVEPILTSWMMGRKPLKRSYRTHPPIDIDQQVDETLRLRLRLEGLVAAMNGRHDCAKRLARIYRSQPPQDFIPPWRYGASPLMRDRENGLDVRAVMAISNDAMDAFIARCRGFDTS